MKIIIKDLNDNKRVIHFVFMVHYTNNFIGVFYRNNKNIWFDTNFIKSFIIT